MSNSNHLQQAILSCVMLGLTLFAVKVCFPFLMDVTDSGVSAGGGGGVAVFNGGAPSTPSPFSRKSDEMLRFISTDLVPPLVVIGLLLNGVIILIAPASHLRPAIAWVVPPLISFGTDKFLFGHSMLTSAAMALAVLIAVFIGRRWREQTALQKAGR